MKREAAVGLPPKIDDLERLHMVIKVFGTIPCDTTVECSIGHLQ
jgi:hypothetical protein